MLQIGLMVVPGSGYQDVTLADDTTVQGLIDLKMLKNRSIVVDGKTIEPADYATTSLQGVEDVWATGGAKGA